MAKPKKTEADHLEDAREKLISAALNHVPFDGWGSRTFHAAIADSGVDPALAKLAAPRGGLDLAVAFHKKGDEELRAAAADADLSALRYSERVARLIRMRIEIAAPNREAVRRGVTLFALPINAAEGARLIWGTADAIWTILGDTSRDYNWYSKRAILSGVYSSSVLYWLGDQSEGFRNTWDFVDRRIADVMQFEKVKAQLKDNKLAQIALAGPKILLSGIRAPGAVDTGTPVGLPGRRG